MLDALEIDPAILPPRAREPCSAAARPPTACRSRPARGDQAAGALGVGVDRPGPVSVALGTSGVVFAALPAFAADPQARVHAFCHAVPGAWHAMGVMLSAGGALRWLRDATGSGAGYDALGRGGRARGRRAPRACSSSPTSPASARRTPTPTRAARSPA